ncbi:MAG TPA: DMT family transporter [Gammaproteobacteria bacterium]
MHGVFWLVLVAALGGVAVALQAQLMGQLDRGLGSLESVFITYGGGGLMIGLVMLALRGGNLAAWAGSGLPWYTLSAGAFGLVIVGAIGYTAPRLGLVAALTVVVAAQFIAGMLLEHYGLLGVVPRPFDGWRALGLVLLLAGTWLLLR